MKTSMTFELALTQYDAVPRGVPPQKRQELPQLAGGARTFEDWLSIYYRSREGSRVEKESLQMLDKLRASVPKLLETLEFAPLLSPLRKLIEQKLAERGVNQLNGHQVPFTVKMSSVHGD